MTKKAEKSLSQDEIMIRHIYKNSGETLNFILTDIFEKLTEEEIIEICYTVSISLCKTVGTFNAEAREIDEKIIHYQQPERNDFREIKNIFLAHEHQIKPFEKNYNDKLRQTPTNPLSTFLASVLYLVYERRLFKRYLKTRFGIKIKESAFIKLPSEQVDKILCEAALESYVSVENQFFYWLYAIHLILQNRQNISSLENLVSEILIVLGKALQDFRLFELETTMKMNDKASISNVLEIANLAAWAEANLSFSPLHNKRLAKTVEIKDKENIKNDIPGAVILALAEKKPDQPFSSGTRKKSVLSHIASQLEKVNLRVQEIDENNVSATLGTEDFTLREEARIDLMKIINRANLTPQQKNIYLLKEIEGFTFDEIASELKVTKGTCSQQYYRAKKKIEEYMT